MLPSVRASTDASSLDVSPLRLLRGAAKDRKVLSNIFELGAYASKNATAAAASQQATSIRKRDGEIDDSIILNQIDHDHESET